jgi:hypothetical protein
MLSYLVLNKKWHMYVPIVLGIWCATFLSTIITHFCMYGTDPVNEMAYFVATVVTTIVLVNSINNARKKRIMLEQIADLNNKLTPLCLLPQVMSYDRTNSDAKLIEKCIKESKDSIVNVNGITKELWNNIEKV